MFASPADTFVPDPSWPAPARRCAVCHDELPRSARAHKLTCSDRCRQRYSRTRRPAEPRRALRLCAGCGAVLLSSRARTCSSPCRQLAYRRRAELRLELVRWGELAG